MNILNLLIKEKNIVGVEINDKVIRIAYFSQRKKNAKNSDKNTTPEKELILIEEPISENIIEEGCIKDKALLSKIIKGIWTKEKLKKNYAIVSIPENKIYSHIFSFPKTVNESSLKEAINLAIDFQLPVKKEDSYISYENAGDSHTINEVLISTIPKKIANDYTEALNNAGVKMLALESHLNSIARSIKLKLNQATIFVKKNTDENTIFIIKDSSLKFSRGIPLKFVKKENEIENELKNIKISFESEKNIPVLEAPFNKAEIRDEYLKYIDPKETNKELQSKWLISIGAAIRGQIPKGQDNKISLLPIGTAEAYAYQKTTTFITLIRNMTIGLSIFFLFTFVSAYLLILSLSQAIIKTNINISASPISPEILKKEPWIKNVNMMTEVSKSILSNTVDWSILIDDISARTVNTILISNMSVSSINDEISLIGIAKDRNSLNLFKKSLQESPYLTTIELPIANLEQKENIPFSISFRVKDPSMLYYK